jgi:hypothetical protein
MLARSTPTSCDAQENVRSTVDGSTSRKMARRFLDTHQAALDGKLGVADRKSVVPLREERGETTVTLPKAMDGAPGTPSVRWRFSVGS